MGSLGQPASVPEKHDDHVDTTAHDQQHPSSAINPNKLWYIHGKAYDLTGWLDNHPGGSYALLNCRGFDATAMFESYHPFTDRPRKLLSTFKSVEVPEWVLKERCVDRSKGFWFYLPDGTPDPFYAALKERCGQVVKELQIQRLMDWPLFLFLNVAPLGQVAIYYFGFLNPHLWVAIASAVAMALFVPLAGLMAHEAVHGSIVSGKNWLATQLYEFYGLFWIQNVSCAHLEHAVLHHSETVDVDDPYLLHSKGIFRLLPSQKWHPIHRLQAHRWWRHGLFCFFALFTLTIEPVLLLLTGEFTNPPGRIKRASLRPIQLFKMVFHLLAVNALAVVIPVWVNWSTMENKAILILERIFICMVYLSLVGQYQGLIGAPAHIGEENYEAAGKPTSWAQKEVETSSNFVTGSRLALLISAGTYLHIVHHLFPGYCSDKHHLLAPAIKDVCKEFGVQYIEHKTFASAFTASERAFVAFSKPPASDGDTKGTPTASPV